MKNNKRQRIKTMLAGYRKFKRIPDIWIICNLHVAYLEMETVKVRLRAPNVNPCSLFPFGQSCVAFSTIVSSLNTQYLRKA